MSQTPIADSGATLPEVNPMESGRGTNIPVEMIVLASVSFGIVGQLVLKASLLVFSRNGGLLVFNSSLLRVTVGVLLGCGIYLLGSWFWVNAVSRAHISYLYPLSAVSYALVAYGGHFFFGEAISALRWTGIAVICLGSALLVGTSDRGIA